MLQKFARRRKIQYLLLSDSSSKVIREYGILNKEVQQPRFQGIPHPGLFILDREGRVRKRLFYEGFKKRHDSKALIEAVRELRQEAEDAE